MSIYDGIELDYTKELDDFLAETSADVIRQYVLEDGIKKNDPNDHRVEMMMRFSERYFLAFQAVIELKESKGEGAVGSWQAERHEDFVQHATIYQDLYKQVAHLIEPPFFITNWSMCYLVDTALKSVNINSEKDYLEMDEETKSKLEYSLRFGDNLLQTFQSKILVM